MKLYHILTLLCLFTVATSHAQKKRSIFTQGINIRINDPAAYEIIENYNYPTKKVLKAIEKIILEEKIALKNKIKIIDKQLNSGEITKKVSEKLKAKTASEHAANIEVKIGLQYEELQKTIQDYTDEKIATISVDSITLTYYYGKPENNIILFKRKSSKQRFERLKESWREHNKDRINNQGAIMFGVYNVINNGKFSTDYKTWQSAFWGYGHSWKYRLSENFSPFYLKFGSSILFNNLRPTDNRYFIKNKSGIDLTTHPENLKVSRLKNVQLIFPVHLQIDFSKPHYINDIEAYANSHRKSFRIGIGGYAGFRLHSRQILKYKENGINIKEKFNESYNLNSFTYGLSAYFGYRSTALYTKYDINTLFKNGTGRGISLGLRLEI